MIVQTTIDEKQLKDIIVNYMNENFADEFELTDLKIQVKVKKSYGADWEEGLFKCVINKQI